MKLRTLATTLAAAAAWTLSAPAWAGYVLSFNTSPSPVYAGEAVTVDVMLTNDPSVGLNFLAFDLQFDASILEFQSAIGRGFFADEAFDAFEGTAGVVSTLVSDNFLTATSDDGIVGAFTFLALGAGTSDLGIDLSTAFATDGNFDDRVDFSVSAGSITVQSPATSGVPAPGTLLLAGLGLALLGGTRRRAGAPAAVR